MTRKWLLVSVLLLSVLLVLLERREKRKRADESLAEGRAFPKRIHCGRLRIPMRFHMMNTEN